MVFAMKLAKKGKIQLIQGAARLGPLMLIKQTWLAFLDSFVRKRHLVFKLDTRKGFMSQPSLKDGGRLREVLSADELKQPDLSWLTDPQAEHDWGAVDWLISGWRLWLLEEAGEVQALAWVRDATHSRDFFVPLGDKDELFWHVYVLPGYRGHNLQGQLWRMIAADRASDGVDSIFTNCRDYNLPSRRNILKMGFSPVGQCDENRIMRRRVWRSY